MRMIDGDALMNDLVNAIASQKRWMDSAKKSNSGNLFQLAQQAFFTLLECKQHLEQAPTISPTKQPPLEEFEWCTDCKEYDHERHCCHRFTKVILKTVDELQVVMCKDCIHDNACAIQNAAQTGVWFYCGYGERGEQNG